jgi:hypothetical protein
MNANVIAIPIHSFSFTVYSFPAMMDEKTATALVGLPAATRIVVLCCVN